MQVLQRVLLIEDDRNIASALAHAFQHTYNIDIAERGKLGLAKSRANDYDLVLLDLNLPDVSGIRICKELRNRRFGGPILILSGEHRILTKIDLLDAGANDYLTKPFSLGELKARLRVLLRSFQKPPSDNELLSASGISLNRHTAEVTRDGIRIKLRHKEFSILEQLLENTGEVVSRDSLAEQIWRGDQMGWASTINVHVKYLRDKIDRPFARQLIQTVHGCGYRLNAVPATLEGKR